MCNKYIFNYNYNHNWYGNIKLTLKLNNGKCLFRRLIQVDTYNKLNETE